MSRGSHFHAVKSSKGNCLTHECSGLLFQKGVELCSETLSSAFSYESEAHFFPLSNNFCIHLLDIFKVRITGVKLFTDCKNGCSQIDSISVREFPFPLLIILISKVSSIFRNPIRNGKNFLVCKAFYDVNNLKSLFDVNNLKFLLT